MAHGSAPFDALIPMDLYRTPVDLAEVQAPRLVVAIDFGTFASGYALQWRSDYKTDPLKVKVNTKWAAEGFCTYKTLTCLLLNKEKNFEAFGYEAEKEYTDLATEDPKKHATLYLFRFFKMALYHRDDLRDDTPIESQNGSALPAITVLSHCIQYMKNHVLEYLEESGVPYPEAETKWVLTVPAIWDDPAKAIMRRAAVKAGIQDKRLTIALEPEAAAIYCSMLPKDQLQIEDSEGKLKYLAAPGSVVMVTDMGGGTVDITTVKVMEDGKMRQVLRSGGGAWGGRKVDEKFIKLMHRIVGQDVWEEFARANPNEEYEFRMKFESGKRSLKQKTHQGSLSGSLRADKFKIKLPSKLKSVWEAKEGKKVNVMLRQNADFEDKVEFKIGSLVFQADMIRELFTETIQEIIQYVNNVLDDPRHHGINIDAMILVGGFAESGLVTSSLREGLKARGIPLVRPEHTELAVMNGAVLFGQNEAALTSRIVRFTYGVGMCMEFIKGTHNDDKKFESEGKLFATNVFRKHVTIGDEVKVGQWVSLKEYYPLDENQTTSTVLIFTSTKKDPIHTDEPESTYIGQLEIEFSRPTKEHGPLKARKATEVAMCFGGTELEIRATDKASGATYTKRLNH